MKVIASEMQNMHDIRLIHLSKPFRWPVLLFSVLVNFVLLQIDSEKSFLFCSLSITAVSTLSISYYLYEKYHKVFYLNCDVLIAISTLTQFLLPIFFLAFYYSANPSSDRHGFRFGYCITSFAALLGQVFFFLGYESFGKPKAGHAVGFRLFHLNNFIVALLPFLLVIWVSRYILLATGTYYHLFRSGFQFNSPYYSVISQVSSYGLISVIALFLLAFLHSNKKSKRNFFLLAIFFFVIEILWQLLL